MAGFLKDSLTSAGRVKLHVSEVPLEEVRVPVQERKVLHDTVAALRLDSVLAVGFSISRSKASQLIASGRCAVNWQDTSKSDLAVRAGDVISCRGLGKFGKRSIPLRALGVVIGSCLYRIVVAIALRFDLPASALKLVSAIIVAVAISYPTLMKMVDFQQKKLASRGKDLYRIMLAVFAVCCLICVLLTVLLPGSRALFILLAVLLAIGIVWAAVRERKLKKGGAAKC